jgi:hypothetical protein
MDRRSFLLALPAGLATVRSGESGVEREIPNRPRVPGTLELHGRRRQAGRLSESVLRWDTAQTAIIICDMWNTHTCASAAQRVATMAPRMNGAVSSARGMGVMIIHAPQRHDEVL